MLLSGRVRLEKTMQKKRCLVLLLWIRVGLFDCS